MRPIPDGPMRHKFPAAVLGSIHPYQPDEYSALPAFKNGGFSFTLMRPVVMTKSRVVRRLER